MLRKRGHRLAAAGDTGDYARDLASAAVRQGRLPLTHRIEVEDKAGKVLLRATFADPVEVTS
ncbi:DUF6894 family protein [Sphingobium cyanobacteriorum]|uniref:DUF6894 family protein n=1 Tax=Sphingobium cyanobacteriorum TaxID=3063954 RepID=UPI003CC6289E